MCCASRSTSSASVCTVVYLTDSRENMEHKNSRMCACWAEGEGEEEEGGGKGRERRGRTHSAGWMQPKVDNTISFLGS